MARSRWQKLTPFARRLASIAMTMLFASCATRYLVPAPDAQRLSPEGAAVIAERGGIQVVADPRAWSGSLDVLDDLVPIWLSVTNRSDRIVHVSPTDVELVGNELRVRAELPFALTPQPLRTTVGSDPTVPDDRLAPSDQIEQRSKASRLHDEIQRRGLRDHDLETGQTASGFVYFERSSWDPGRVEIQVTLRERAGGSRVATVRLPFSII